MRVPAPVQDRPVGRDDPETPLVDATTTYRPVSMARSRLDRELLVDLRGVDARGVAGLNGCIWAPFSTCA